MMIEFKSYIKNSMEKVEDWQTSTILIKNNSERKRIVRK